MSGFHDVENQTCLAHLLLLQLVQQSEQNAAIVGKCLVIQMAGYIQEMTVLGMTVREKQFKGINSRGHDHGDYKQQRRQHFDGAEKG
jgi:hypothetical protein